MQAPVTGGDSVRLECALRVPQIVDILPGRNELLVVDAVRGYAPNPLWSLSTMGANPRPVGDLQASDASWTADGQRIIYASGNDVFEARSDGSGSRRLLTAPAQVLYPRLSPDGQRLRFTVMGSGNPAVWEAVGDGSGLHRLLPGWNARHLLGSWTPDGRHYIFHAMRDGEMALWAVSESGRWPWSSRGSPVPVRLTTGPLSYYAPTVSPDGRVVYALGRSPGSPSELVRYDASQAVFTPFLSGLAARDVEFSRDGRWIAYVRHPDGTLWRSRRDGTEGRQLTFPPLTAALPRWSPDGRRIAYMSQSPGEPWHSAIVATEGGDVAVRGRAPLGRSLLVTRGRQGASRHPVGLGVGTSEHAPSGRPSHRRGVPCPGAEGQYSPRWSPDGRSIVALSAPATRLALYDVGTRRWRDLIAGSEWLAYPSWTRDSSWIQLLKGSAIVRVRVSDGHVERLTTLERIALVDVPWGGWVGLAPDDSPIALRAIGATEIYALDVEWP